MGGGMWMTGASGLWVYCSACRNRGRVRRPAGDPGRGNTDVTVISDGNENRIYCSNCGELGITQHFLNRLAYYQDDETRRVDVHLAPVQPKPAPEG